MKRSIFIPNSFLFFLLIIIVIVKSLLFFLIQEGVFSINLGGGNDADYYHGYALGYYDLAVNSWPILLRSLDSIGMYSRESISYIFLFINLIIVPIITAKLSGLKFYGDQKYYLYVLLICSIYPTIFIFTFDIYRDVFMILMFLFSCLFVKAHLRVSSFFGSTLLLLSSAIMGFVLLGLRPYLGYAFLISLFLWKIRLTKKRTVFLGSLYLVALFVVNYIGFFESLIEYRSGFEESTGGSTLGLDFSNPIMFIPNFILSFLGQMLGLYITNPLAIVLLLIETIPFFFMLLYIMKNIKFADGFVRFLIIFFVLYASVWLIGNDNLGTAVRLRIYNYLAIYISFFYILRLKNQSAEAHRL